MLHTSILFVCPPNLVRFHQHGHTTKYPTAPHHPAPPITGFYEFQKKELFRDTVEITVKRPFYGAIPDMAEDVAAGVQSSHIRKSFVAVIKRTRFAPALPMNPSLMNIAPGNTQRQQVVIE